ncbi:MAG: aspartate carbamoyltransferase regulatory subunit [Clostridiales bacterium]|nr:aspartate carbamoyltransferase regulatory subunit [Clostridiales bacterium]
MNIDSIHEGLVLDHIQAGRSMEIYRYLHLDQLDCSVAIIKNVKSRKMGKKDIIKIDEAIELNLDVLGYIDPDITVNIIRNGRNVEKKRLSLPEEIVGVVQCRNPRCVTSTEDAPHVFRLTDRENQVYRCVYCETSAKNQG